MASKDYYLILGIPRSASGRAIRSAFHSLAKKLHPDRAGPESADAFREVMEAYEVLSDPSRRRGYDSTLAGRRPRVEPLVGPSGAGFGPGPSSTVVGGGTWVRDPFLDALAQLDGFAPPRTRRTEPVHVEVVLSEDEAARGTVLPIQLPEPRPCPWCGGRGWGWPYECVRCDGRGWIPATRTMGIPIPAGVRAGSTLDVSLHEAGIEHLFLRVHVRVGG